MEADIRLLKERVEKIQQELGVLYTDVQRALSYAKDDPESAATKAGRALESMLLQIHRREVDSTSTRPLTIEQLKEPLARILPDNIKMQVEVVQRFRNHGAHHRDAVLEAGDINAALSAFVRITEWYVANYGAPAVVPELRRRPGIGQVGPIGVLCSAFAAAAAFLFHDAAPGPPPAAEAGAKSVFRDVAPAQIALPAASTRAAEVEAVAAAPTEAETRAPALALRREGPPRPPRSTGKAEAPRQATVATPPVKAFGGVSDVLGQMPSPEGHASPHGRVWADVKISYGTGEYTYDNCYFCDAGFYEATGKGILTFQQAKGIVVWMVYLPHDLLLGVNVLPADPAGPVGVTISEGNQELPARVRGQYLPRKTVLTITSLDYRLGGHIDGHIEADLEGGNAKPPVHAKLEGLFHAEFPL